jgi:hypothetical protein
MHGDQLARVCIPTSNTMKRWPLPSIGGMGMGGTKGWTSDSGWVCMLRTSHRLLATALGRVGGVYFWPLRSRPSFSSAYLLVFRFLFALSLFVCISFAAAPAFPPLSSLLNFSSSFYLCIPALKRSGAYMRTSFLGTPAP